MNISSKILPVATAAATVAFCLPAFAGGNAEKAISMVDRAGIVVGGLLVALVALFAVRRGRADLKR